MHFQLLLNKIEVLRLYCLIPKTPRLSFTNKYSKFFQCKWKKLNFIFIFWGFNHSILNWTIKTKCKKFFLKLTTQIARLQYFNKRKRFSLYLAKQGHYFKSPQLENFVLHKVDVFYIMLNNWFGNLQKESKSKNTNLMLIRK